jgi:hypothetical protein
MLTAQQAAKLNTSGPDEQSSQIGSELYHSSVNGLYTIDVNITADARAGKAIPIPFNCEIVDVICHCKAAGSGAATVIINNGATAITDAIVFDANHAVTKAGSIDDSVSSVTPASVITAVTNEEVSVGRISLLVVRR